MKEMREVTQQEKQADWDCCIEWRGCSRHEVGSSNYAVQLLTVVPVSSSLAKPCRKHEEKGGNISQQHLALALVMCSKTTS